MLNNFYATGYVIDVNDDDEKSDDAIGTQYYMHFKVCDDAYIYIMHINYSQYQTLKYDGSLSKLYAVSGKFNGGYLVVKELFKLV